MNGALHTLRSRIPAVGFFDGFGKHLRLGRHDRRGNRASTFDTMAAEADATRIRLSDHTHEGVSRIPSGPDVETDDGPDRRAMPHDKPDPRAQWDGVAGEWIIWDDDAGDWVPCS